VTSILNQNDANISLNEQVAMENLRQRWEKATERGVRYYEIQVQPDLWGQWMVTRTWGRQGTTLGQTRHLPCPSYPTALSQWEKFNQRRLQRGYHPVLPSRPA
jgi:predicted DNA-binding WGR domain protein